MAQRQAAGHIGGQATEAVDHGVVDRLQSREPITNLSDVRPRLGGGVVHADNHPHPAISPGPGHGGIGVT